jgi:hypothetical protein
MGAVAIVDPRFAPYRAAAPRTGKFPQCRIFHHFPAAFIAFFDGNFAKNMAGIFPQAFLQIHMPANLGGITGIVKGIVGCVPFFLQNRECRIQGISGYGSHDLSAENSLNITAQDIDYSASANETLPCSYEGAPIAIGFKSTFLLEIFNNLESADILIELADKSRPGVFRPIIENADDEMLVLLMPIV